jgi:hypothetical protein
MPWISAASESARDREGGVSVIGRSSTLRGMEAGTGSGTGSSSGLVLRLNAGIGYNENIQIPIL